MCITWWWGMVLACFHSLFISPRQPSHWSHDRFLAILLLHVASILVHLVHSSSTSGVHCWNLTLEDPLWHLWLANCRLGMRQPVAAKRNSCSAAQRVALCGTCQGLDTCRRVGLCHVHCSKWSALQTFLFYLYLYSETLTFFLRFSFCAPWCGMCFSVAEACSCSHLYAQLWHASEPSLTWGIVWVCWLAGLCSTNIARSSARAFSSFSQGLD